MVDGNQLQAHRTWWELRWDVVLIVLAIIAPIVSIVFDVNSEKPDWIHRSGSLMVFCAGFLAYRSLSRHFQNVYNIEKRGHVLATSRNQRRIDWMTLTIAATGTVIWGYGDLVFPWL